MKPLARWALATAVAASLLLGLGDSDDPWLWAYVAVFAAVGMYAMLSMDEDLMKERFTPPSKGADRLSLRAVRLIAAAHIAVAIADSRFKWTHVPDVWRAIGLAGFGVGFLVIVQAMKTNRFFSSVVRIQEDRGHRLIDTGPYAVIRHPGYAGMIPAIPLGALALGSWLAVAVALTYSILIWRRVRFEDRFLQENLAGYEAYTHRVRYRLVPGVW